MSHTGHVRALDGRRAFLVLTFSVSGIRIAEDTGAAEGATEVGVEAGTCTCYSTKSLGPQVWLSLDFPAFFFRVEGAGSGVSGGVGCWDGGIGTRPAFVDDTRARTALTASWTRDTPAEGVISAISGEQGRQQPALAGSAGFMK